MTRFDWLKRHNATLIGSVMGIDFFEDPTHGDATGMWAVLDGEAVKTDWYDLPSEAEVEDVDDFMNCYRVGA